MSTASRRRRQRRQRARAKTIGLPPGAPVYVGDATDHEIHLRVYDYGPQGLEERDLQLVSEAAAYRDTDTVSWINMDGVHDVEAVGALCERFGVHPLWVEDIVDPAQRPRTDALGELVFVVARVARILPDGTLDTEQVSLVVGRGWLLSFQERPGDVWDPVRNRLLAGKGRLRNAGPDYLLFALLDAIVDHYFLVLEHLERQVDAVEDRTVSSPSGNLPIEFLSLKQELAAFRGCAWPMRESVGALLRSDSATIVPDTHPFLRDLYDHAVQVMDIHDAARERLLGVVELNVALQGQRLNEIMKVLTLVSTVFIPLGFLAGLYGMNFVWMPELQVWWAYPVVLGVMATVAIGMAAWFRSKRWV